MKKSLKDIESVMSLHGCGEKKVLLAKEETQTNLTQIAIIYLKAGEEGDHRASGSFQPEQSLLYSVRIKTN